MLSPWPLLLPLLLPAGAALPAEWRHLVARGEMLATSATPLDGLFPAVSNGFLAGDAGCSNVTDPPTTGGSTGRVHLAGVFNNETYYDDEAALLYPRRAPVSNPFSVVVDGGDFVGAALDVRTGVVRNRTRVPCGGGGDGRATAPGTVEVETMLWADRHDRHVLRFTVHAPNASELSACGGAVPVSLRSCALGLNGTRQAFDVWKAQNLSSGVEVWALTVRAMEQPPAGSNLPPPNATEVGVAFQPLPSILWLSAAEPVVRRAAVFHSTIERDWGGTSAPGEWSATDNQDLDVSELALRHLRQVQQGATAPAPAPIQATAQALAPATTPASASAQPSPEHAAAWAGVWQGGVEIEGNASLARAVNASVHALVASLRPDFPLGASPGGLTHNCYEGHSFWDAETWMFPALLLLFPDLAATMVEYRAARLAAAQDAARLTGVCGGADVEGLPRCARWPWESALLGFGVSPWVEADEYEIHVSGDVARAVELAFRATGNDPRFFEQDPRRWEMVAASATFFAATAVADEATGNWTFHEVIGPDESAGVVNNSAYTNAVAQRTLLWACEAAQWAGEEPAANWSTIAQNMYLPVETLPGTDKLGHPEYAGYAGQDINQADVALLQYPLEMAMESEIARNDLEFYEQRSSTQDTRGFYTGDSAYSIAWLRLGDNASAADAQFLNGLRHIDAQDADEQGDTGGFGVWKETLQDGGGNLNFLTGAGGWLQNLVFGYGGLALTANGTLAVDRPSLPPSVTALTLRGLNLGLGPAQARFSLWTNGTFVELRCAGAAFVAVRCADGLVVADGAGGLHGLPVVLPADQRLEVALVGARR